MSLEGLKPEIIRILPALDIIHLEEVNRETIITGAVEDRKLIESLHPRGFALDLRTRDIAYHERLQIVHRIRKAVGNCYDVVLEANHTHVEYDPKNGSCGRPAALDPFSYHVSNTNAFLDNIRVDTKMNIDDFLKNNVTHRIAFINRDWSKMSVRSTLLLNCQSFVTQAAWESIGDKIFDYKESDHIAQIKSNMLPAELRIKFAELERAIIDSTPPYQGGMRKKLRTKLNELMELL